MKRENANMANMNAGLMGSREARLATPGTSPKPHVATHPMSIPDHNQPPR
jgi:hypothetical protein